MEAILRFVGLDLELDKELQEITDLACAITKASTAVISFLDADTQYFKVKKDPKDIVGEIKTFLRKDTFCSYTIKQDDVFIIADTLADERFANNESVIGNPNLRFYAGVPLSTCDGQKVGTLCVLDTKPGNLDENQVHMFKIIARQTMKTIELKCRALNLEESLKEVEAQKAYVQDADIRLRSFFESSNTFQVLLGKSGEVIDFNKTAYNFIKNAHKTDVQRGDLFVTYIAPEFVSKFIDGYNRAIKGTRHIEEGSTDYGEKLGIIWWDATFEPALDKNNEIIGMSYLIRNVTERKVREQKIIQQNESLLSIAHVQAHEFRAPLTTIMGLMSLIKDDGYEMAGNYLPYLEMAVNNLDEKIKNVVVDIENNMVNVKL
ncbi:GAF domain-containing protein [Mucilaginibacter sp. L196]|uniref:sensor histidine kinase n=1 Tax=Mucilaginibacter sp. L196 TaxID=1641870 RepID=UPI00131E586C|nr:GAF domain-containing protein [Mucilaginibacter sp. L196]